MHLLTGFAKIEEVTIQHLAICPCGWLQITITPQSVITRVIIPHTSIKEIKNEKLYEIKF